ncbi:DUF4265 domain-containing protein [Pontibacter sp. HSC-14F20]|uniref:DUF4265 domain-containing protein n=1 Tax=Pontibacter sp. HSC-14F20 TaxID=2864136 RepID=UPI001C73A3D0|nr:DUF4265 domain-containing protein [Pontibacter sp. HSC-14F20]MBX0335167.1 DUF4265 domain-containing protein [Pontibacter sp. HSC-14F20]
MNEEGLLKVHIDLPNHWGIGGESLWAEPLGNDLYKIENVPFYAYGLNFQDIVRATPDSEDHIPEIRELITPSGHRTFRVFFKKHIDRYQQEAILDSMESLSVTYERANNIYVALDMKPEGDYQAVFDQLEEYLEQDILGFETCEARIEGSFDDFPEEEEEENKT